MHEGQTSKEKEEKEEKRGHTLRHDEEKKNKVKNTKGKVRQSIVGCRMVNMTLIKKEVEDLFAKAMKLFT